MIAGTLLTSRIMLKNPKKHLWLKIWQVFMAKVYVDWQFQIFIVRFALQELF